MDEIPLPQVTDPPATMFAAGRIPLPTTAMPVPPFVPPPPHGILKKAPEPVVEKQPEIKKKEPPGCPPGPPPNLEELHELDSDYEDEEPLPAAKRLKSIRFSDETNRSSESPDSRDSEKKDDSKTTEDVIKQPTALQQKMLAISGQNIDEFMKEMENVHKRKEQEKAADQQQETLTTIEKDKDDSDESDSKFKNDFNLFAYFSF